MKRLLIFLTFFTSAFSMVICGESDGKERIPIFIKKGTPSRPGKPSSDYLNIVISEGQFWIEVPFESGIKVIEVCLYSDKALAYTSVSTSDNNYCFDVSGLSGEYTITCSTNTGKLFYGTIYLP